MSCIIKNDRLQLTLSSLHSDNISCGESGNIRPRNAWHLSKVFWFLRYVSWVWSENLAHRFRRVKIYFSPPLHKFKRCFHTAQDKLTLVGRQRQEEIQKVLEVLPVAEGKYCEINWLEARIPDDWELQHSRAWWRERSCAFIIIFFPFLILAWSALHVFWRILNKFFKTIQVMIGWRQTGYGSGWLLNAKLLLLSTTPP